MEMRGAGTVNVEAEGEGYLRLCLRVPLEWTWLVAIVVLSNSSFAVLTGVVASSPAVFGSQTPPPTKEIAAMKQWTTVQTGVGPWAGKQGLGAIGKWGIQGACAKGMKRDCFGRTIAWGPGMSFQDRLGVPPR
jgi:hypothetical protein